MSALPSARILQNQLKQLHKEPVDGFTCELRDDKLYEWIVYMRGPPDTYYEGGIFKLYMTFPEQYPFEPPSLRFLSDFWHPNVYPDGRVCISILHPPTDDVTSGERPEERWLPVHTPETSMWWPFLVSVMSMLSDPNFSSPANVDASVELRRDRETFIARCKKLSEKSMTELPEEFEMPEVVPYRPMTEDMAIADDDENVEYYFEEHDDDEDNDDEDEEDDYDMDEYDDEDEDDVKLTEEELREVEREVEEEMRREGA